MEIAPKKVGEPILRDNFDSRKVKVGNRTWIGRRKNLTIEVFWVHRSKGEPQEASRVRGRAETGGCVNRSLLDAQNACQGPDGPTAHISQCNAA